MMDKYVCIDIGGTEIKYGLVDKFGRFLCKYCMKTEAQKGGTTILNKVIQIVEEFVKEYRISGVCISTAGMVDTGKGSIFYASSLIPDYTEIRFKKIIETRYSIPCEVENDVNCAGLAEYVSGAAKDCGTAVMLTVGTGIGGSLIIDGKVFHGFSNSACEVGYMHMGNGDFQSLGATSVLAKKVAARKQDLAEAWDGYRIFEEAERGDEVCCEAIDEMVEVLGQGIANICYVVNPEIVVLGGGIMVRQTFLKDKVENAVKKYLNACIMQHTKIDFAKHGNDAGMLGAFYHFCQCKK